MIITTPNRFCRNQGYLPEDIAEIVKIIEEGKFHYIPKEVPNNDDFRELQGILYGYIQALSGCQKDK